MRRASPPPMLPPHHPDLAALARAELVRDSTGPWLIAFSGGPDSTALATALARADPALGVDLHLVHLDHGLDASSAGRAERAEAIARQLGLTFHLERRRVPEERRRGENLEAAARRIRYASLEALRQRLGADRILTAHHRDDQVETTLLRLRAGSGIFGLAGIQERHGAIWRPALRIPRVALRAVLGGSGIEPTDDPTNRDLARDRNRIRHLLLPRLQAAEPELDCALAGLAERAFRARSALAARLRATHDLRPNGDGADLSVRALRRHPRALNLLAVQLLEQLAGYPTPSSTKSRTELIRQVLETAGDEFVTARGRRLRRLPGDRLALENATARSRETGPFSYTLRVPGEVAVTELGGVMRLTRCAIEPWMTRGEARRAALRIPEPAPRALEVRNRRSGDRLRPLGAPGMRGLKEVLIDRKVARAERDRIPLLVVDGRVAWVPGITIDDAFRLPGPAESVAADCWVAEWQLDRRSPATRSTFQRAVATGPEDEDT